MTLCCRHPSISGAGDSKFVGHSTLFSSFSPRLLIKRYSPHQQPKRTPWVNARGGLKSLQRETIGVSERLHLICLLLLSFGFCLGVSRLSQYDNNTICCCTGSIFTFFFCAAASVPTAQAFSLSLQPHDIIIIIVLLAVSNKIGLIYGDGFRSHPREIYPSPRHLTLSEDPKV